MVARCALLLIIAISRGVFWILEQPRGSLLEMHPVIQALFTKHYIYRKFIRMGDFGGETEKPTWLYSGEAKL